MSLDFDFTKVEERLGPDWYAVVTTSPQTRGAESEKWHPITDRLIWKTLDIGMGSITEENVDEFWFRLRLIQQLDGPDLEYGDGKSYWITKQDVLNHIGMKTNASNESRAAWVKRTMEREFIVANQPHSAHPNPDRESGLDVVERRYREAQS